MKHLILLGAFVLGGIFVWWVSDRLEMKGVIESSLGYNIIFLIIGLILVVSNGWGILKRFLN